MFYKRLQLDYKMNYGWIWIEICLGWRCEAAGIYKFLLGRECSGSKEYFRMLFKSRIMHDLMVEQEVDINGTQYIRSRVYRSKHGKP
jgi:hypothetical protein